MDESNRNRVIELLDILYEDSVAQLVGNRLINRLDQFKRDAHYHRSSKRDVFSERDVILITYGDMFRNKDDVPLVTLRKFLNQWLHSYVNTIHLLPFYPYSSDDGFSVIDYTSVNPALGTWGEIEDLKSDGFRLMFDAVINHISTRSAWFQGFQNGDPHYKDYFITIDPATDLTLVTRPRAHPLLTPFETATGEQHVWTTFSPDQADLNYKNPETLLDVIDVLLTYIERGADIIRLDAIAYLWKEPGTSCVHLPQTHAIVQLLRIVADEVAPGVLLITETNVPHKDNVSYFGNGSNEAHLVYNFTLPPLAAYAIVAGTAEEMTKWAKKLEHPSGDSAFFNFTASHDGVGLLPVHGILRPDQIELLLRQTQAGHGAISYKTDLTGTTSPYELNISYFDLLNAGQELESQEAQVNRFMVTQAMMLALAGVPGIYLHSLLGSRNDLAGVKKTGIARSINREKLDVEIVETALRETGNLRREVFLEYCRLLKIRRVERAFHPSNPQQVMEIDQRVFAVQRLDERSGETIMALHNVSGETISLSIPTPESSLIWQDLLSGVIFSAVGSALQLELSPYQVSWLKNSPASNT